MKKNRRKVTRRLGMDIEKSKQGRKRHIEE
jgi:hypothetical protein